MPSESEILLVEDDDNDLELTLEAFRGVQLKDEIVLARDGAEALDYFAGRARFAGRDRRLPRLVLLDLKLPKLNGLEVLKEIKSDDRLRDIPVVVLTSSREQSDLSTGYRLGLNAYVVKPVGFDDFVESVRQLARFWGLINEGPPARPQGQPRSA